MKSLAEAKEVIMRITRITRTADIVALNIPET